MMNKYFLTFSFLAICLILYIKISKFYNIIEGARNCDPNKAKVYNRDSRDAKTCQNLKENEADENLKLFKKKLNEVKNLLEEKKNEYNQIILKQKENTDNIKEAISSLDCKEEGNAEINIREYKLDCSQNKDESSEEESESEDEVDIDAKSSSAAKDASKHSGEKYQF